MRAFFTAIFVPTLRSRAMIYNGHRYNVHRSNGSKTIWRCTKRNVGCKSIIWTINDEIIHVVHEHDHYKGKDVTILVVENDKQC